MLYNVQYMRVPSGPSSGGGISYFLLSLLYSRSYSIRIGNDYLALSGGQHIVFVHGLYHVLYIQVTGPSTNPWPLSSPTLWESQQLAYAKPCKPAFAFL